jgi:NDP-sugar pyrophosphorylase family protein
MAPLVDRPFLQHILEHLIDRGASRFDLVLGHLPDAIRSHFGDGSGWGVQIRYWQAQVDDPYAEVVWNCASSDEFCLLGQADHLPAFSGDAFRAEPAVFLEAGRNGDPMRWSGWVWLREAEMKRFADNLSGGCDWRLALRVLDSPIRKETALGASLSARSLRSLLASNRDVLNGAFPGLDLDARLVAPDVWVGRGAKIHPTATLFGPLYIGPKCWIGKGCEIGPKTVVGSCSVVEDFTKITESVILPYTYLGPGISIADSVVRQDLVVNVQFGSQISVSDNVPAEASTCQLESSFSTGW